jgi:hypothetical protein
MPFFHVDQQSVKELAKSLRVAFGNEVKHMQTLKAICVGLGVSPDALLNKLNRFAAECRDPEPPVIPPKAFASRLAAQLSSDYGRAIAIADVEALIAKNARQIGAHDTSRIVEAGKGDAAFFHLLFLMEHDREMRMPRPVDDLDRENPHHQLAAALAAIERDDHTWGPLLRAAVTGSPKLFFDLVEFGFPIFGELGALPKTSKIGMSWLSRRMGLDVDLGLTPYESHVVDTVMGPTFSADRLRSMAIGEFRRIDLKGRAFKLVEEKELLPLEITEVARTRKVFTAEQYLEFFGEEKPQSDRQSRLAGLAEKKIAQAKAMGIMR